MTRMGDRPSSLQRALGFSIVAFTAYVGCVGDPPKRVEPDDGGSGGTAGSGTTGTGGSAQGGKGGKGGSGGANSAGTAGSGGGGSSGEGGAGAPEGGAPGSAGEGGAGECPSGLVTCPGSAACTTDLDVGNEAGNTVDDCGECGVSCSLSHATSSTCSSGVCEPVCETGFDDCNAGSENDGCETDLSSAAACGACGRACSRTGAATTACTDSKCVPSCAAGFFDCNLDDGAGEDDGCELYRDTLAACGATCESDGTACEPDEVCNAGTCAAPAGLVVFTIPFTTAGQIQRYGNRFASPSPNLTNSTVVMRVYAPGALGGSLFLYPTDASNSSQGPGVRVPLESLGAGWVDVEVPIAGVKGEFDPAGVFQLTIEVEAGNAGPWAEPTVLYVDSIRSSNALVSDTFDANFGQMVTSTLLKVEGSTLDWVPNLDP